MPPWRRVLELSSWRKKIENQWNLILRDAFAGIGHLNLDLLKRGQIARGNPHGAGVREFDRVID